jgi:hypothetical protein
MHWVFLQMRRKEAGFGDASLTSVHESSPEEFSLEVSSLMIKRGLDSRISLVNTAVKGILYAKEVVKRQSPWIIGHMENLYFSRTIKSIHERFFCPNIINSLTRCGDL